MHRAFVNLVAACVVFASATYAATIVPDTISPSMSDAFFKYAWALFISCVGWAASSLPMLADWGSRTPGKRLIIVKGILQALFFGFGAFLASNGVGQNIMLSYLASAAVAYGGDSYFTFGRKKLDDHGPGLEGAKCAKNL